MKLKPLKEILAMSKEKLDEAYAPIRAKIVRSKARLEMSKLDDEILSLELEAQEVCSKKDLDFNMLFQKLDRVALLERRKRQYTKVIQQLFPDGPDSKKDEDEED